MKILILGSEGFIGSHCVDFFIVRSNTVFGVDLYEKAAKQYNYTKLSKLYPEFDEIFSLHSFDAVINAAGSGNVPYSMSHPLIDFEANSLDTIRVLDAIRKHQPECRYIHISSAAVYGNPAKLPVQEFDITVPLSPYGWHKLISEQLCREYVNIYKLQIAIIRPFSVYGPGLKKQLFWDLYKKIQNRKGEIELHGTGEESRDYIYIEDLVSAIGCIIHQEKLNGEIYNVASGTETKIAEVVELFMDALHTPCTFRFNGVVRAGEPLNWYADITNINAIGFLNKYTMQQGMRKLADWMLQLS